MIYIDYDGRGDFSDDFSNDFSIETLETIDIPRTDTNIEE